MLRVVKVLKDKEDPKGFKERRALKEILGLKEVVDRKGTKVCSEQVDIQVLKVIEDQLDRLGQQVPRVI